MKKICLFVLPVLFVISGLFLYKNISAVKANSLTEEQMNEMFRKYVEATAPHSLTEEQINELFREYVEATYGPGTDFSITSYGESGIGYINHETGEVILYVTNPGDER